MGAVSVKCLFYCCVYGGNYWYILFVLWHINVDEEDGGEGLIGYCDDL